MFGLPKVNLNPFSNTNSPAGKAPSASKSSTSTRVTNLVAACVGFWAAVQGTKDLVSACKKLRGTPVTTKNDVNGEITTLVYPSKKELALPVALGAVKLGAGIVTVRAAFGK